MIMTIIYADRVTYPSLPCRTCQETKVAGGRCDPDNLGNVNVAIITIIIIICHIIVIVMFIIITQSRETGERQN